MSSPIKKAFLTQQKSFKLGRAVEMYVEEKNEPFANYQQALLWFSSTVGFEVTKSHLQRACKNAEVDRSRIVRGCQDSFGGFAAVFRRIDLLEQRLAKIERDLN